MLSENDLANKDLDGYHVATELEADASGRIFLGESISPMASSKHVIIKFLRLTGEDTQQEREEVLQAITAIQQLHHPHILPILSAGIYKDIPYIITENATSSLAERLQLRPAKQPMPQEEALSILAQIGQALQYAHEKHVIHGELKPQDVFFDDDGNVLVAGFYAHYLSRSDQLEHADSTDASIYLAPEQLAGRSSERSDQYALGCLAYEMLTGSKAFMIPSVNTPGTFYRTKSLVVPGRINPALPADIGNAILKAMSKDPDLRYDSIAAFLTALGLLPSASSYQQDEVEMVLERMETMTPRLRLPVTPIPADTIFGTEDVEDVDVTEKSRSVAVNARGLRALDVTRLVGPGTRVSFMAALPEAISRNVPFKASWGNLTLAQRRIVAVLLCMVVIVLVMGALFISSGLPKGGDVPSAYATALPHAPTQTVSSATSISSIRSIPASTPGGTASVQNTALAQGTGLASSTPSSQSSGTSSQSSGASQSSNTKPTATSAQVPTPTAVPVPTPTAAPVPTPTVAPTPTPTPASTLTEVALSAFFNNKGIGNGPGGANFDGSGYSYPASQLPAGGSITVSGVPYQFPSSSAGSDNVIAAGQTIGLTAGHYQQADLLVAASWGPVTGTVTIEYSDGSATSTNLTVADWIVGSANSLRAAYRYSPNSIDQNAAYIYAIAVGVDANRTVRALVLPGQVSGPHQSGRLHVFAVTMMP
jgi:serine/threonine protein kinase